MDDQTVTIITIIIWFVIFLLLIKVVVKTFKRQTVVAILCIIFLLPIYFIWDFCELFNRSINKE